MSTVVAATARSLEAFVRSQAYLMTMLLSGLLLALRPSTWVHPVRNRLARQILFAGVEAIPLTMIVAALMGGIVYLQCYRWLEFTGRIEFLGRMIALLLFQMAAPFLTIFIVIGASASAITTEMATMKTNGEVALLEAQGVNVFRYMVVPRMVGLAFCVLGLTLVFAMVAIAVSGIGFVLFSADARDAGAFFDSVFGSLRVVEMLSLMAQTIFPGLTMGAVCCYEGLRVSGASTEVPQAVSRAILRSIIMAVLIAAVVIFLSSTI